LFALPLAGRHAILARLLLLLVELFHMLLDFLALADVVARGVMHREPCAAVVTARHLMGALVVSWATTPTNHYSSSCSSGGASQGLVVATDLLAVVVATALSSRTRIGLAYFPCLWGRWRMPSMTLCGPGALVHQAEELGDVLYVTRGQLL
jgi:hypothetical protein